jgi:biopolymer transport protein ExbD
MDSVSLRFHGRPVSRDELRELLKRRVDAGTKVSLVLRASGDVSTGRVSEIVQLARALGITHIARAQTE